MKTWLAAVLVLFGSACLVRADIGPKPTPAPDKSVPIVIETVDGKPGPARLIIPKKLLDKSRASLDLSDGTAVAEGKSRLPMMLAGIFLALSIAFAGLWLVRQRGVLGTRTVALLLGGILFLAVGSAVLLANGAPAFTKPIQPLVANPDRVIIEVTDNGDTVKLVVHKSKLAVNGPRGVPVPLPAPVPQPVPIPRPGAAGAAPAGNGIAVPERRVIDEQPAPKPVIKE